MVLNLVLETKLTEIARSCGQSDLQLSSVFQRLCSCTYCIVVYGAL